MYIIVRDIKDHTRWMNAALWRPWLRSVAVGVCLFLGILAGSWGLTRWYVQPHIESLIETKAVLEFEIQEATPAPSSGSRRRRGAWFSTREKRGGGSPSCQQGRSRIHPGPWAGDLPCRFSASEGAL